ncbi:MAG: phosphotransferase [Proteobacteria bacterium]|nr:phosphotransferase [Pseudomonadota bacterium]
MVDVVENTLQITPEWLTGALKSEGLLKSRVTSVRHEVVGVGVGLMAELARLAVEYEGPEDLPATFIAKCAARNENRAFAQGLDFYNRETNFYSKIGQDCPFRVPKSYFGEVNQSTYDFVLLMEDLGDVAPNDQITGSSEAEAFDKARKIAELHARFWNRVHEPENGWMYDMMSDAAAQKLRDMVYAPALEPAIVCSPFLFSPASIELVRKVGERYVETLAQVSPALSYIHGDFRQDNFIYQDGDNEAVVMDWQISGKGYPIFDLTYFVCQSLQVPLRRQIERDLVATYVETLAENGVTYDMDTAWQDYRILTLVCLIYPISVCGTLDTANERGRRLAECMLDRNLSVIDDLNCGELVL